MSEVMELTNENFDELVINSGKPALVDFWAEWCMPCKMVAPTIKELAGEYGEKVVIGSVDTDNNREIAMRYGISAIPTLILFKDGEMAKKFVGVQQKNVLKGAIDELLD
ncbi:MAG: thioredoxin [Phycisphaerae bacterium]